MKKKASKKPLKKKGAWAAGSVVLFNDGAYKKADPVMDRYNPESVMRKFRLLKKHKRRVKLASDNVGLVHLWEKI